MSKKEHSFDFYPDNPNDNVDKAVAWFLENYDRERLNAVARLWHQTQLLTRNKKELMRAINDAKWPGIYNLAIFWIIGDGMGNAEERVMKHFGIATEDFPTIRPMEWDDHLRKDLWNNRTEEFELPDE